MPITKVRQRIAECPDPEAFVRGYLDAMEARDLATARSFLGEGFEMTFPGSVRMTSLEELIAWAKPRYQHAGKTYEGFDVAAGADMVAVVCRGTLSGLWPDGTAFEGIRFIDRFELREGKIIRQDVWNDLAGVRP